MAFEDRLQEVIEGELDKVEAARDAKDALAHANAAAGLIKALDEHQTASDKFYADEAAQKAALKAQKKELIMECVKIGLDLAMFAASMKFTYDINIKSCIFEETGSLTSTFSKKAIEAQRPFLKRLGRPV